MSRDDLDAAPSDLLVLPGIAILAGAANVIMQLSNPAVGHGVYESTVDSGNLFKHPLKRQRTTLSYIAVATLGEADDRRAFRHGVNTSHAQVRSTASSPLPYNAFDPALQLWVAACLYKGWEDMQRIYGDPRRITEEAYQQGSVYGTTLQMPREMWPATRSDFQTYWDTTVAGVSIDPEIRRYLLRVARAQFLPAPVSRVVGPFAELLTVGFLPEEFRNLMGVEFSARQQRIFDAHNAAARVVVRRLPGPLLRFPFNVLLRDVRRRVRAGRSPV